MNILITVSLLFAEGYRFLPTNVHPYRLNVGVIPEVT